MKAYKLEVFVIDMDGIGPDGIKQEIENGRYGNDCISPSVKSIEERDIGVWSDDHPLNLRSTAEQEYVRLFGSVTPK